ncbi:MAG: DnaJ domain-containing protein, partial [Verrucomicrobiota bacterium]
MAVEFRDYYEVLGVSRDASPESLKRAFRKLARQYHPDVASDIPDAESRFKAVNEAYEVLSDPEKRRKYDALGQDWQHGAEFRPFGEETKGGNGSFEYHFGGSTGFSDFFESFFGTQSRGGEGMGAGGPSDPFGAFGEQGQNAAARSERGADIESDLLVKLEEVLYGAERLLRMRSARNQEDRTIRVKIPAGIGDGQVIRCAGFGRQGGKEPGDLLLRVRLERHPMFQV